MRHSTRHPDVVHHIADFTSLRDVDLLELSLLKSIFSVLRPLSTSLISIDTNNIELKRAELTSDSFTRIFDKNKASPAVIDAIELMDTTSQTYLCTTMDNGQQLALFLLSSQRRLSHYVMVETDRRAISSEDTLQIVGMLAIYRNFRVLLNEAHTDELTGLPNRKAFNSTISKINEHFRPTPAAPPLERRMNEMTRSRYWLALADLDNFKSINDSLGHLMGDEVLVRTGQAMRESLRDEDMVFRYGGEEFAIIVEAEDPATAQIAVDRVRRRIEQLNISAVGKVTASFGVAELDADTFHITSIESADKALYESKTSGKNKITFSHLCNSANASRFDDIEFF